MHKFEYEIQLNEDGRPYISIPDDYVEKPEDKFMALELTCYILRKLIEKRKNDNTLDEDTLKALENSFNSIITISDEVGAIIREHMEATAEATMLFNNSYHIQVEDLTERDALNYNGIIRGDKIFKRMEGLRVLVNSESKIYELREGIDNVNWIEL